MRMWNVSMSIEKKSSSLKKSTKNILKCPLDVNHWKNKKGYAVVNYGIKLLDCFDTKTLKEFY